MVDCYRPVNDWGVYRACPICKAPIGEPCRSLSGTIVNGRPDGTITALETAHIARARRTGR